MSVYTWERIDLDASFPGDRKSGCTGNDGALYFGYNAYVGIRKSTDGGNTWAVLPASTVMGNVASLAVSPSGAIYASDTANAKTYRSTDGGASWTWVSGLDLNVAYPIGADAMAFGPDGTLYLMAYNSIYRSSDSGNTLDTSGYPVGIVGGNVRSAVTGSDGALYVGTGGASVRICVSRDRGARWGAIPRTSSDDLLTACLDAKGYLHFGTYSEGVYSSLDNGNTWGHIIGLDTGQWTACTVGLDGTLFFAGYTGGGQALYRGSAPPPPPPAPPAIYPPSGTYQGTQLLTILATGGTVHYTTDGSDPTAQSPVYAPGYRIQDGTTIKAVTVSPEGPLSPVSSATYSLTGNKIQAIPSYTAHVLPYLLEQYKGDNP